MGVGVYPVLCCGSKDILRIGKVDDGDATAASAAPYNPDNVV